MNEDLIIIKDLKIGFGLSIEEVFLHVEKMVIKKNDFIIIVGPNGSGKSTLCKILSSIWTPQHRYGEIKLPNPPPVLVWQNHELFPLKVKDNISLACKEKNKNQKQAKVDSLLQLFNLSHCRNKYIGELSGGEEERVSIARALATDSEVLIYDEPTQSIDPSFVKNMASIILSLYKKKKMTTVVVTHDTRFINYFSEIDPIVYSIEKNKVSNNKTTLSKIIGPFKLSELFDNPQTVFTAELLGLENIFKLARSECNIEPRFLLPLEDEDFDQRTEVVAIPDNAFDIRTSFIDPNQQLKFEKVEFLGVEFRSGGRKITKYQFEGAIGKNLDFLVQTDTPLFDSVFLGIHPDKCHKFIHEPSKP